VSHPLNGLEGLNRPSNTDFEEHSGAGDTFTGRRLKYVQIVPLKFISASNASLTYYGVAAPGVTAGASLWRIFRTDNARTFVDYADGNDLFDNLWTDRENYIYF
jgi:hypothetical protein